MLYLNQNYNCKEVRKMNKSDVLKDFPTIPANAELGCFLWDDPLFNQRVQTDKQYLEDEEFIVFRRQARLIALETLYIRLSAVENSVQKWKEAAGRQAWCVKQLLDR